MSKILKKNMKDTKILWKKKTPGKQEYGYEQYKNLSEDERR